MTRNIIEKIGNVQAIARRNTLKDWTVILMNGTGIITQDVYFGNPVSGIESMMQKVLDTYTEEYILLCVPDAERISENTYKSGELDWFCRIDSTRFFKHFYQSADEFIRDKNGLRIIDK